MIVRKRVRCLCQVSAGGEKGEITSFGPDLGKIYKLLLSACLSSRIVGVVVVVVVVFVVVVVVVVVVVS